MSSKANTDFWNNAGASLSFDLGGYSVDLGKDPAKDNELPAKSTTTTTDTPKKDAMTWIKDNPLAVGVGVVAVLAVVALSMGGRK
jgi:hypothetical protein